MTVWDRIEDIIEAHDGHLELVVAAQCCWRGELRIGLTNPPDSPARSMVFFAAGGASPREVAKRLLVAAYHNKLGELVLMQRDTLGTAEAKVYVAPENVEKFPCLSPLVRGGDK